MSNLFIGSVVNVRSLLLAEDACKMSEFQKCNVWLSKWTPKLSHSVIILHTIAILNSIYISLLEISGVKIQPCNCIVLGGCQM